MSSEEVVKHLKAGDLEGAMIALASTAETIAREMRKKLIRNALIMGALLALTAFALVIGYQGHTAIRSIHRTETRLHATDKLTTRALDGIVAQRAESRRLVCENDNRDQLGARSAHLSESHDLVAAIAGPNPDASTLARIVAFNQEHDALIVKNYPLRDCSPEGIRRFYNA